MSRRYDKFTERAKMVLVLAQEEAQCLKHNYIGTEHLLLGLIRDEVGTAARVLGELGVELDKVRPAVNFIIGKGDRTVIGDISLTPRAKKVIELSVDEARQLNAGYVGTEHLLLGLVREGSGVGAGVLRSLDVQLEQVREAIGRLGRDTRDLPEVTLPTRIESSLRQFFSGPRDTVVSVRVEETDVQAMDALVEAGIRKTRSEAAAWLIQCGIEANQSLFDKVQTTIAEIRRLREEAQGLARQHEESERSAELPAPPSAPEQGDKPDAA